MAHIRQGLQSSRRLTAARIRGYSLTLPASPHLTDYDLMILALAITFAVCGGIPRQRDQPAGGGMDRAAGIASRRGGHRHTTRLADAVNTLRFHLAADDIQSCGLHGGAQTRAGVI